MPRRVAPSGTLAEHSATCFRFAEREHIRVARRQDPLFAPELLEALGPAAVELVEPVPDRVLLVEVLVVLLGGIELRGGHDQIGRAHLLTPVTSPTRMPAFAWNKKKRNTSAVPTTTGKTCDTPLFT